ncbi:MAG: hypothetical protein KF716_20905 [Anaerolineae bacterium]|nr:hypothetical protein [Anaerolineae bacterium]
MSLAPLIFPRISMIVVRVRRMVDGNFGGSEVWFVVRLASSGVAPASVSIL